MDRRKFLKLTTAVSAFGGLLNEVNAASGAIKASEFNQRIPAHKRNKITNNKVVIIGGGISGLTAAYELRKMGHRDFALLEARTKVGGRVETIRRGDIVDELDENQICLFDQKKSMYFNAGAARISQNHTGVLSYCSELGVPLELISNDNKGAYFYSSALSNERLRIRQLQSSLRGHLAQFMAKSILSGDTSMMMSADEVTAYLTSLTLFGDLDSNFEFIESKRLGVETGTGLLDSAAPLNATDMSEIVKLDAFSQYKLHLSELLDQQSSMMQPIGGMDKIIKALTRRVRRHIHLESEVVSVKREGNKSRVTYRQFGQEFDLEADKVILAIPPHIATRINHDFSSDVVDSLESYSMSKAAKVAFQSDRFWEKEDNIYGGISYSDKDMTLMWYPSNDVGDDKGIIVGAYNVGVDTNDTFGEKTYFDRIEMALEQGEDIHPGYRNRVYRGLSRSWLKTPFIEGGWSISEAQERLLSQDGPYIFAGDYVSQKSGWMEGAIASAQHAITLLSN